MEIVGRKWLGKPEPYIAEGNIVQKVETHV